MIATSTQQVVIMAQRLSVPVWPISAKMREVGFLGDVSYRQRNNGASSVSIELHYHQGIPAVEALTISTVVQDLNKLLTYIGKHSTALQLIVQPTDAAAVGKVHEVTVDQLTLLLPGVLADNVVFFLRPTM